MGDQITNNCGSFATVSTEAKTTNMFTTQTGQGDYQKSLQMTPPLNDHIGMFSKAELPRFSEENNDTLQSNDHMSTTRLSSLEKSADSNSTACSLDKDTYAQTTGQRIVFISTVKSDVHTKDSSAPLYKSVPAKTVGFPFFKLTTVSTPVVNTVTKPFYVVQKPGQVVRASSFGATKSAILTPGRSIIANCPQRSSGATSLVTQKERASATASDLSPASGYQTPQKPIITLHLTQNGSKVGVTTGSSSVHTAYAGGPTYTISVEQGKVDADDTSPNGTANVLPGKTTPPHRKVCRQLMSIVNWCVNDKLTCVRSVSLIPLRESLTEEPVL